MRSSGLLGRHDPLCRNEAAPLTRGGLLARGAETLAASKRCRCRSARNASAPTVAPKSVEMTTTTSCGLGSGGRVAAAGTRRCSNDRQARRRFPCVDPEAVARPDECRSSVAGDRGVEASRVAPAGEAGRREPGGRLSAAAACAEHTIRRSSAVRITRSTRLLQAWHCSSGGPSGRESKSSRGAPRPRTLGSGRLRRRREFAGPLILSKHDQNLV
jgi:hypothetical protein